MTKHYSVIVEETGCMIPVVVEAENMQEAQDKTRVLLEGGMLEADTNTYSFRFRVKDATPVYEDTKDGTEIIGYTND